MFWKIVVVLSVSLCVQGEEDAISEQRVVIHHQKSVRGGSLPHIGPNKSGNQDDYARAYPSYEFSYHVNDPKTHDIKGQHETRKGDEVIGNYWLIEPNGRKRTVNYQANDDSGFNAQIDYTASLKNKETDEDVSVSQGKNTEEDNVKENNDEGIKISVGEEIQEIQDSNDESEDTKEDIKDPAPVEENNLSEQNESDSQKDEANNINNIDRNDKVSQIQIVENKSNLENNESNLSKSRRGNNGTDKGKRENSKRHNNHDQVRYGNKSNKNNRERPKNIKREKQDDSKRNSNNNRNAHKENKMNSDRSVHNQEHINNDSNLTVKKGQIDTDQEQNQRNQYGFRKGENNNNNEESNNRSNKKNYADTDFAPTDEIHRKIDSSNSEDTFEHRIRIYHPKNISPISKGGLRKH